METDILAELTLNDLEELREIYRKVTSAFHVSLLIDTIIRWKRMGVDKAIVTSCNNSWREDGAIVCIFYEGLTQIFIHSFDADNSNIQEGISKTRRIDFSKPLRFLNVMPHCINSVKAAVGNLDLKNCAIFENHMFSMNIEKAKDFEENCPTDMYIRQLDVSCANEINDVWPHKFQNSEEIVMQYIERNGGYGLFKKNGDELVSWVLQGPLGHINLLQTKEEYKGRGFGKLMCRVIAKSVAESGHKPTATVIVTNTPSISLFNKLGFDRIITSYFVTIGE